MLETHLETFLSMQNSDKTRETYRTGIQRFLGWYRMYRRTLRDEAPPLVSDIATYKTYLATSGLSERTQTTYWDGLKAYFRWLVNIGALVYDPVGSVKPPARTVNREPWVPSDYEVGLLRAEASKSGRRRNEVLVNLLLNGLRVSEAVNATWRNVIELPPDNYGLRIVGKGRKERVIPMTVGTKVSLNLPATGMGLPIDTSEATFPLVTTDYGRPISVRQAQDIIATLGRRAGVSRMHPHALRHHYGTRLARGGANVFALSKLLGHESVKTTQRYVGLDRTDILRAAGTDPLFAEAAE